MFCVVPGRADERDTASQRLERANCWNSGKLAEVWPPGDVQRHARAGEDLRDFVIWQPSSIPYTRIGECRNRFIRKSDSINFGVQLEIFYRLNEEFPQLRRTLVITPITDPNQIQRSWDRRERTKHSNVRCFMPRPCAFGPAVAHVLVCNDLSISKHTVIVFQTKRKTLVCCEAMMRVVEQQKKIAVDAAILADAFNQLGFVPFMNDYQVRAVEHVFKIQSIQIVPVAQKLGIRSMKLDQRLPAVLGDQVLHTPRIARLVNLN